MQDDEELRSTWKRGPPKINSNKLPAAFSNAVGQKKYTHIFNMDQAAESVTALWGQHQDQSGDLGGEARKL